MRKTVCNEKERKGQRQDMKRGECISLTPLYLSAKRFHFINQFSYDKEEKKEEKGDKVHGQGHKWEERDRGDRRDNGSGFGRQKRKRKKRSTGSGLSKEEKDDKLHGKGHKWRKEIEETEETLVQGSEDRRERGKRGVLAGSGLEKKEKEEKWRYLIRVREKEEKRKARPRSHITAFEPRQPSDF